MLREEAARLLMMIQGAYPNYKPLDKSVAVNTYAAIMAADKGLCGKAGQEV